MPYKLISLVFLLSILNINTAYSDSEFILVTGEFATQRSLENCLFRNMGTEGWVANGDICWVSILLRMKNKYENKNL